MFMFCILYSVFWCLSSVLCAGYLSRPGGVELYVSPDILQGHLPQLADPHEVILRRTLEISQYRTQCIVQCSVHCAMS